MKILSRIVLLLVLALVLVAMLVPNTALAFLREEYVWLGRAVNWVEALWPGVDMDHVLVFGVLGIAGRLAGPRTEMGKALFVLVALAALTELMQLWVPGRTPSLDDAGLDVAGGLAGYTLASLPFALHGALAGRQA